MDERFTSEFIAEQRELAGQATPRPWEAHLRAAIARAKGA
jgi:hypothetical protein